jgi:predicted component of type VI protein secretion system
VKTREQAVEAMHVAARYFALREPSSPVPILLREAQAASTKSFYELVNDLVPDGAASAFVSLGAEPWFDVYLSTLDARNPAPDYDGEEEEPAIAEDSGLGDDEVADDTVPGQESDWAPEEAQGSTGDSGADEGSEDAGEIEASEEAEAADRPEPVAESIPPDPRSASAGPSFTAGSRAEAVALLRQILEYYRVAEPSSPVPLLVERAIDMSSKSFIELLGKILPEGSLKVKPQDSGY